MQKCVAVVSFLLCGCSQTFQFRWNIIVTKFFVKMLLGQKECSKTLLGHFYPLDRKTCNLKKKWKITLKKVYVCFIVLNNTKKNLLNCTKVGWKGIKQNK